MAANLQNYQDLLDLLIAEIHSQSEENKQETDQKRLLALQETLQQERTAITTLHKDLEGALLLELSGEFPDLAAMSSALKNIESHYQKLGGRYRQLYQHWKENFAPPAEPARNPQREEPEVTVPPPDDKPNPATEKDRAQAAVEALNTASREATAKAASVTDQETELTYRKLFADDAPIVTIEKIERTEVQVVRAESWAVRRIVTPMLVRKDQPAVDQFRSRMSRNEADTPLKSTFSMRQPRPDIESSGPGKKITPEEAARFPLLKNTAGRGLQHKQPRYTKPKFNTIIACVSCGNAGYKTCKDCGGDRLIKCSGCGGEGKNDCYRCKGTTNITCTKCNGSGTDTCPYCAGAGQKKCKICRGTGVNGMLKCTYCNQKGHTVCPHCTKGKIKCGIKVGTNGCGGTTTEKCPTCGGSGKRLCVRCNGKQTFACTNCHADVTNPKTYGKTTCPECRGKGYFIEHHFVETDVIPPDRETYLVGAESIDTATRDKLLKWYGNPDSLPLVYSALPGQKKISAYLAFPKAIKAAKNRKRSNAPVLGYLSYTTVPVATLTCRNVLTNHTPGTLCPLPVVAAVCSSVLAGYLRVRKCIQTSIKNECYCCSPQQSTPT